MKRFFTLANLPETRHETALWNNYGPEVVDDNLCDVSPYGTTQP